MDNFDYTVTLIKEDDTFYDLSLRSDRSTVNGILMKKGELLQLYKLLKEELAADLV